MRARDSLRGPPLDIPPETSDRVEQAIDNVIVFNGDSAVFC